MMRIVYDNATVWSRLLNVSIEVDHIIPLNNPTVCGLHCWNNLQLLDNITNASKNNNYQQDW